MVWNCSIVAVTLLFGVSGKSKAFRNESKTIGENDRAEYGKKLLEQALIDHLQHFLLELGRGFSFVARQKRFTLDGQDFFIDLVFYNYKSSMECSSTGTADQYDVLSAYFSKPG